MILVHHDDAAREWAYGAESTIVTFSDPPHGRGEEERLVRDQHEERLESCFSL